MQYEQQVRNSLASLWGSGVWVGIARRVRGDMGTTNSDVAFYMLSHNAREPGRGSYITGRSVHNSRIKRLWHDVHQLVLFFYYLFLALEASGLLDPDVETHLFCLHYTYLSIINPLTPVSPITAHDEPWPFFLFWRHHFWPKLAPSTLNFCRRKRSFQWCQGQSDRPNGPEICTKMLKKLREISCHYTWLLHAKNCPSWWCFLRSLLTASKPSRSITAAKKKKEKEKKERRKKNFKNRKA